MCDSYTLLRVKVPTAASTSSPAPPAERVGEPAVDVPRAGEHRAVAALELASGQVAVAGKVIEPRRAGGKPQQPPRLAPAETANVARERRHGTRQVDPARWCGPVGDVVHQDGRAAGSDHALHATQGGLQVRQVMQR